ncbi:uncharacterized protein SOCE26_058520 [Sorangium cellulosum]|uniref:Transmembrane protein n=1 Tax=Sorangium cellulosum TaxID=56 RepID=A0A2L0EYJ7_SORCE|nr:hypothetical protein [Sorangium cellulosum]AUX44388.1 uncharacterized protein SOCE26_058520 [Sorangium cellulosum]
MFFWDVKALRVALAHGTLSERARFVYLFIFVSIALVAPALLRDSRALNAWDKIQWGVGIAAHALGTLWLYHLNGGSRGRRFLEKYLSLSWVYTARFLVMVVLPVWVPVHLGIGLLGLARDSTGPFDVAMSLLLDVAYYVGFGRHIRWTVAAEAAAQRGAAADAAQGISPRDAQSSGAQAPRAS